MPVHKARPFFKDLVEFMISGPVMIQALEGEGAIAKNRDLMGATDPKKAEKGTDPCPTSPTASTRTPCTARMRRNGAAEVAFFFPAMNVYSR
jgi:nucleoside-diphosphate kinase